MLILRRCKEELYTQTSLFDPKPNEYPTKKLFCPFTNFFSGSIDSPRDTLHAPELLDDAQFVFAAEVVADVVIMYLSFIHNYLI